MTRHPGIPATALQRRRPWFADLTDDAVSSALWAIAVELLYDTNALYRPPAPRT